MILRHVVTGSFRVVAAVTDRGECPLVDFLEALDGDLADDGSRMVAVLERVASSGPRQGTLIVCPHGFIKKTPKTPPAEIRKATSVHNRYFIDKRNGNIRFEE